MIVKIWTDRDVATEDASVFSVIPQDTMPASRRLDFTAYMALFTEPEQVDIATAAMSDVDVKRWYDLRIAASFTDLDAPATADGLDMLVGKGLITPGRRDAVLAG